MFFFFFSSRRRHTRCSRDWSSDVCSSDLFPPRRSSMPTRPLFLPCVTGLAGAASGKAAHKRRTNIRPRDRGDMETRSEEHTSELQSRLHLVCRLLLEKKKTL